MKIAQIIQNLTLSSGCALLIALLLCSTKTQASDVLYQFDTVFSANSQTPTNPAPWVDASFQDVSGGVLFTITNVSLYGSEFVDTAYFNLTPNLQATNLTFSLQGSAGVFQTPNIMTFYQGQQVNGSSGNKADGDGYFDFVLYFAMNGTNSFAAGESISYLITGISGLDATNFVSFSQGGNNSEFLAALHVQNVLGSGQKSAFEAPSVATVVPVPEPSTIALFGISLIGGLICAARRRF